MTLLATLSRFAGFDTVSKIPFAERLNLRKQRHDLSRLTKAQLEDIGVTQAQAEREARRSIWDAPDFWYK
jgi:uncharacterized protein YjiS (DUF1127 family)